MTAGGKQCPVCKSTCAQADAACQCGYNFLQRVCTPGSSCAELMSKQQGVSSGQQPANNTNIPMDNFPNLVASAQIKEPEDIFEPDENDEVKPGRELTDEEKKRVREKTFESVGGDG